ncbi:heat shock protein 70 family [Cladochytrium replicatum]|nr:heat shock protein 70 family [Cladochytrium replicatum]
MKRFQLILIILTVTLWASSAEGEIIGIHVGTNHAYAAVQRNGHPVIVGSGDGLDVCPIHFLRPGNHFYVDLGAWGYRDFQLARKQYIMSGYRYFVDHSITDFEGIMLGTKHFIGRGHNVEYADNGLGGREYRMMSVEDSARIESRDIYSPQMLTPDQLLDTLSNVLRYMKEVSETRLGESITDAVLSVPAHFNAEQRAAIKHAARCAELNPIRLISEPTATAIAYRFDQEVSEGLVLVYHFGGRGLDLSLLVIEDGVYDIVSTERADDIGGEFITELLLRHFVDLIRELHGIDLWEDNWRYRLAIRSIRDKMDLAKRALSEKESVVVRTGDVLDGMDFIVPLTRQKLEELSIDLIKNGIDKLDKMLERSNVSKQEVIKVAVSGGGARMPLVTRLLEQYFDGKAVSASIRPELVVAYGLADQAEILSDRYDSNNFICCIDLLPLTIGIETSGGVMTPVITRNSIIPNKKTVFVSTGKHNQTDLIIRVFEGERPLTKYNHLIGEINMADVSPRGNARIEVAIEVEIGENPIQVRATDLETGRSETVVIDREPHSQETVEQMIMEAEINRETDIGEKSMLVSSEEYLPVDLLPFQ